MGNTNSEILGCTVLTVAEEEIELAVHDLQSDGLQSSDHGV